MVVFSSSLLYHGSIVVQCFLNAPCPLVRTLHNVAYTSGHVVLPASIRGNSLIPPFKNKGACVVRLDR